MNRRDVAEAVTSILARAFPGALDRDLVEALADMVDQLAAERAAPNDESRGRYADLLHALPGPIFLKDAESRIRFVNQYLREHCGAGDHWLGRRTEELFLGETGTRMQADDEDALRSGFKLVVETVPMPDGSTRHFETRKFALPQPDEKPWLGGISLDVTRRVVAERERDSSLRNAEHLNRALLAIRNVSQLVARERDFEELVAQTCGLLTETRGYCGAWIRCTHGGRTVLAQSGWNEDAASDLDSAWAAGRPPRCAGAKPVTINEPEKNCDGCPLLDPGHGSRATTPLTHRDKRYGYLGVSLPPGLELRGAEQDLIEEVAADVGFALHSLELAAAQRETEALVRAMFESAPVAMFLVDDTTVICGANELAATMAGVPAPEITGTRPGVAVRCFDRLRDERGCGFGPACLTCAVRRTVLDTLESGEPHNLVEACIPLQAEDPAGELFLYVSTRRLTWRGKEMVLVCLQDTTELCRARQELTQIEEQILTHSNDLVCVTDSAGAISYANRAWAETLGYSPRDLAGKNVVGLTAAEDRADLEGHLAAAGSGAFESRCRHRDGSTRAIAWNTTRSAQREQIYWIGRDVTEEKLAAQSLAQVDRLATMGTLAGGLAHEINNPLACTLFNLELFADSHTDAESSRLVAEALHGARQIREVTRSLGALSWVDDEPTSIDARRALESAVRMARNQFRHRAELVVELGDAPLSVVAPEGRLSQVFLNLLVNAAQAIESEETADNCIEVRAERAGDQVCVSVSDTGCGIDPEHLPRLFEPFFTTKAAGVGSGLGLSICQRIVGEIGGEIEVDTDRERGARFVVRMPAAPAGGPRARRTAGTGATAETRGRVLVVDDETSMRRILVQLFETEHTITLAESGNAARSLIEAGAVFDAIVCDVMMPNGSGIQLHEWLERADPGLARRVIFLTGGAFEAGTKAYLAATSAPVVEKPFDRLALCQLVRRMVSGDRD